MDRFSEYKDSSDKWDSLFTVIIYNLSGDKFIEKLRHQLRKVKLIKNEYKRKYINDRLYNFIEYANDKISIRKNINSVFLIDKIGINEISIRKKELSVLIEYNVPKYIFMFGEFFQLQYINNLFNDLVFFSAVKVKGKNVVRFQLNSTKKKIVEKKEIKKNDIDEYLSALTIPVLVYGETKKLKSKPGITFVNKQLSDCDILKYINEENMKINFHKVQNVFKLIEGGCDISKIVYGSVEKEIRLAIESYRLKELYVSTSKLEYLKKELDNALFNFEIVLIDTIDGKDIGYKLESDYNGAIGIAYY